MSNQGSTDDLCPGKGYTPDYGINRSTEYEDHIAAYSKSTQSSSIPPLAQSSSYCHGHCSKIASLVSLVVVYRRVFRCALIACLASLVIGLMIGFTSPTLDLLDSLSPHDAHHIGSGDRKASLLGVCTKILFLAMILSS